jgi:hypothetical protein
MWPIFAKAKTDFVFRRLFGTEEHKDLLLVLLNALLELDDELKFSIVDAKCRDAHGRVDRIIARLCRGVSTASNVGVPCH